MFQRPFEDNYFPQGFLGGNLLADLFDEKRQRKKRLYPVSNDTTLWSRAPGDIKLVIHAVHK